MEGESTEDKNNQALNTGTKSLCLAIVINAAGCFVISPFPPANNQAAR